MDIVGEGVVWSPNEPVEDVLIRLATGLRNAGGWQGDKAFDANAILSAITRALGQIIDIRTGPRGDPQVRQIASLVNDSWAVTREGLDSLLSSAVWADADGLHSERSYLTFQSLENQVKTRKWDDDEFREAFDEAERVHTAFARRSPGHNAFSPAKRRDGAVNGPADDTAD